MTKILRKEDGLLALSRVFATSQQHVFDAWTQAEQITRWFGCSQTKESKALEWNPEAGGKGVLEMQGCQDGAKAASGQLILEFQEIQPHSKLVFLMEFKSGADPEGDMPSGKVTVEFNALGEDSTEMILTHEGLVSDELRDMVNQGWGEGFDKLDNVLS